MTHVHCGDRHDRREFLKKTGGLLTGGVFGLSFLNTLFLREAAAVTPDPTTQLYDAVIQIFYSGGPSQTDTWDPKPGSNNNVFNTIDLGAQDIYGNRMRISEVFPNLASAVMNDPMVGLGVVRSMTHGNNSHESAQTWMNCFWQSPVADFYPSTAAAMAYYFKGESPIGVDSVLIRGSNGDEANEAKGADTPTAFEVFSPSSAQAMLSRPPGVDAARYARRRDLIEAFNQTFLGKRPDKVAQAWDGAWRQAYDVTNQGAASSAFDLSGKTLLTGGPNGSGTINRNLTLAQELVKAGVPYVSLGIGGNDSHNNNTAAIRRNWGDRTDVPVSQMVQNLKASGKRVLVVMGGEFGRTPHTVAPRSDGTRRDGRDHWGDGFSWAFLSVNQPKFRTTAVGDTGPDGVYRLRNQTLVDPVKPSALGGMLYRALGFPVGDDPRWDSPNSSTGTGCPVDKGLATSTQPGGSRWLLQQFGLS